MSNTTFKNVKNVREPFSSLNVTEGVVFGGTSGTIQVSGNILPGDKPYKMIELFGNGTTLAMQGWLEDINGNTWTVPEDIEIIGAHITADTSAYSNNAKVPLRVAKNNGVILVPGDTIIDVDGAGNTVNKIDRRVSFLAQKALGTDGSTLVSANKDDFIYVDSQSFKDVKVILYYR